MDDRTLREYAYPTDYGVLLCYLCGGRHNSEDCQVNNPFVPSHIEQKQYVDSSQQYFPYSTCCTPEWSIHPNSSWNNQYQDGVSQQNSYQQSHGGWYNGGLFKEEDPLTIAMAQLAIQANQFMAHTDTILQSHEESDALQDISVINVEFQLEQISKYLELESQQQIFTSEPMDEETPDVEIALESGEGVKYQEDMSNFKPAIEEVQLDSDLELADPTPTIIDKNHQEKKKEVGSEVKEEEKDYHMITSENMEFVNFDQFIEKRPPTSPEPAAQKKYGMRSFMKIIKQLWTHQPDLMKLLMKKLGMIQKITLSP